MKNYVKMFLAGIFLATAFPFTMVLLLNGRQGIHKEKQLDPVDYQVLQQMLTEDLSWMSDDDIEIAGSAVSDGSVLCGGIVGYRTALIV